VHDLDQGSAGASGSAVTIGVYDGVHLGHQAVIRSTQGVAERLGVPTVVVTFDRHPAHVLRPESAPLLLTDLDQKLDLLAEIGVDSTVVVPFDEVAATESAEEFVERVIVGRLKAKAVVVGADFHFGRDRAGNVDLLTKLGARLGFAVEGLELLPHDGEETVAVSSTAIRRALAEGDVTTAATMLGRPHEIRGPVVDGDQRGRTIGFATANVAVDTKMAVAGDGVYAGWYLRPDGERWPTAVNIGKRPTFYQDAQHSLVEAHLIDFSGDLYGERARVQLVERLRGEQRFDGIEALAAQLQRDIATAAEVMEQHL
jgi:riboflavin kinase/FMN adenylyltransferase